MRIGVIGSGIAGLAASRLLADLQYDVTVFERQAGIGMDAHSLNLELPDGVVRADVPSRMFNPGLWPHLFELYQQLGVGVSTVDPGQSFSLYQGPTYLKLRNASRPVAEPGLLTRSLRDASVRKMLQQAARLRKLGAEHLRQGLGGRITLGRYLADEGYDTGFVHEFLYPTLSSTVCTCSYNSLDQYPADNILTTLQRLTDDNRLMRASMGTQDVVQRLVDANAEIRLNCPVRSVRQTGDVVVLEMADGSRQRMDHVILAVQANAAMDLIPREMAEEREILAAFGCESIPILVHTDQKMMPANRRDWSTFNMLVSEDRQQAMCSVWLNRFHSEWEWQGIRTDVFQTINAFASPDPDKLVFSCSLPRPVVAEASIRARRQLEQIQLHPGRRIWFCGSYAGQGTPLLESGLTSAKQIVRRIQGQAADDAASPVDVAPGQADAGTVGPMTKG